MIDDRYYEDAEAILSAVKCLVTTVGGKPERAEPGDVVVNPGGISVRRIKKNTIMREYATVDTFMPDRDKLRLAAALIDSVDDRLLEELDATELRDLAKRVHAEIMTR